MQSFNTRLSIVVKSTCFAPHPHSAAHQDTLRMCATRMPRGKSPKELLSGAIRGSV